MDYPILGFAPDLPADTKGVITSSAAIVPTVRGIGSGLSYFAQGTAVSGNPNGGFDTFKIDGTERLFLGTDTKLYEYTGGAYVDRSATAYSANSSQRWTFAQIGDATLAANLGDNLQACTTGNFAAVSGAPKASIVVVVGEPNFQFAMCFDYNDGTNAYRDGVFWSAGGGYTNWTPSIATQCGNVRLLDVNGKFTAACPFRDGVVAFKKRAMYLGRYIGPPAIWGWERISGAIGCSGPNAVTQVDDALYFLDEQGVWIYDGSYPRPCPGYVNQYLADNQGSYIPRLTWDKQRHQLWVRYLEGTLGLGTYLVYNTKSQLWAQYGIAGSVSEIISGSYATAISSPRLILLGRNAPAASSVVKLAAHGSPYGIATFKSIRPNFLSAPTDVATFLSGTLYYGDSLRNATRQDTLFANSATQGLDFVRSARYVAPQLTMALGNAWEMTTVSVDVTSGPGE